LHPQLLIQRVRIDDPSVHAVQYKAILPVENETTPSIFKPLIL
jgi:hypothetical protein